MFELFGGESWSKSIKRSDSVGLVRFEIAIASLLLEDEDDMVWKKLQKIKGGLSSDGIFNLVLLELVSKELNHFGGIASFFRDWTPGTLTGGT